LSLYKAAESNATVSVRWINMATTAKGTEAEGSEYTEAVSGLLTGSHTEKATQRWAPSYSSLSVNKRQTSCGQEKQQRRSATTHHPQAGKAAGSLLVRQRKGAIIEKAVVGRGNHKSNSLETKGGSVAGKKQQSDLKTARKTTRWFP